MIITDHHVESISFDPVAISWCMLLTVQVYPPLRLRPANITLIAGATFQVGSYFKHVLGLKLSRNKEEYKSASFPYQRIWERNVFCYEIADFMESTYLGTKMSWKIGAITLRNFNQHCLLYSFSTCYAWNEAKYRNIKTFWYSFLGWTCVCHSRL